MSAIPFRSRGSIAASIARAWLRAYTFGLSPETRDRRSLELESDLWEHQGDALARNASLSQVGVEILDRTVRGMPADILWRFQLEGPHMQLHIPLERVLGIVLLILTIAVPVSLSISGYDTSRDSWSSELTRLGEIPAWQRSVNIAFQLVSGLALIGGGAGFLFALQSRSGLGAVLAGFGLASAGILTLIASALYSSMSGLATEHVSGNSSESLLVTSRALGTTLSSLTGATVVLLVCGVFSIAWVARRHGMVPSWLNWIPAGAGALAVAGITLAIVFGESIAWVVLMAAFFALVLWLLVAGGWLLFGYRPDRSATATAATVTPA